VGNALIDIESLPEFKNELKGFALTKAVELQVSENKTDKNAIIVFVPYICYLIKLPSSQNITCSL
jgi:hypothetical protein